MDKSMNCITMIAKIHFISSRFHIERVIIEFSFFRSFFCCFSAVSFLLVVMSLLSLTSTQCLQHFTTRLGWARLNVEPAKAEGGVSGAELLHTTREGDKNDIPEGAGEQNSGFVSRPTPRARKQFDEIVMSSLILMLDKKYTNRSNFFFVVSSSSSLLLFSQKPTRRWTWIERRIAEHKHSVSVPLDLLATSAPL